MRRYRINYLIACCLAGLAIVAQGCGPGLRVVHPVSGLELVQASELINSIGYFWQNDSLANNGYRISAAADFHRAKIDRVPVDTLLLHLGTPYRQRTGRKGRWIYYRTFDYTKVDRSTWNGVPSKHLFYLVFCFDHNGLLEQIRETPSTKAD